MIRIYARANGTLAHVWDDNIDGLPEPETTLITTFDETVYETEYRHIADNLKAAQWDGSALLVNDIVYLDTAWIAARLAETNQASAISSAKAGLRDKIALAEAYATEIKILFNAILDQTIDQTVQPTRFTTLRDTITAFPQVFRDRVIMDIQQELNFDVTASLTAAQQRQACAYLRGWCAMLGLLATLA